MSDLECKKQQETLDAVQSSIDKVSHEQVFCFWADASDKKELLKVKELSMNITANLAQLNCNKIAYRNWW